MGHLDSFRHTTRDPPSPIDSYTCYPFKPHTSHFRPTPATNNVGSKRIPARNSSLLATELDNQSSFESLKKRDPFVRAGHSFSKSISSSIGSLKRPGLPWATQPGAEAHRRSHSGSSFGTDFHIQNPPRHSSHFTSTARQAHPPINDELTPGDSSSNWSIDRITRSPSPPPLVPRIPIHLRSNRNMPTPPGVRVDPGSDYDSPDIHVFPAHPSHRASTGPRGHEEYAPTEEFDEEDEDLVTSLPGERFGFGTHRSLNNVGGKAKADKMLGLDTNAKLCSLFMISGVGPTDAAKWVPADNTLVSRLQPQPDSLGFYWRPELLGTAFSGLATEAFERAMDQGKKMRKDTWPLVMKPPALGSKGPHVPDAGPDGAERLISQTLKYAHPRDVEVINTSIMPNTTAHYFSFSLPAHSSTADAARARLNSVQHPENQSIATLDATSSMNAKTRQNLNKQSKITFYGATLTVWTCAESDRARQLADIRAQLRKKGDLDPVLQAPITEPLEEGKKSKQHAPWMPYRNASTTDFDGSDSETVLSGFSGATKRKSAWQAFGVDPLNLGDKSGSGTRGYKGTGESSDIGIGPLKAGAGDMFWMPYALTLVSRHPILDTMIDYIRTSWSMYQKSAKRNLYQMCKILNHPIPRPGEMYRLNIGRKADGEEISIETTFPGAVDFEKGMIKTDFQLWPLFQAVDIDGILTAIEIAMSNSGKVVFTSQYSAMLCLAVHTLRYMVELRGWDGMTVPLLHARDLTLMIEDPGPYIVGLPMECRYMLGIPGDVCLIDLDNNTVTLQSPPPGIVTPRARRDKVKAKIFQALGQQYPLERSIPTELKIAFPNNRFRPFHRIFYDGDNQPHFLGERLRAPPWWKASEVMVVLDRIMLDKHKKPSLIQRFTKSGLTKGNTPISVGEQIVKESMRRRAFHYVETRDEIEIKVAKINARLIQLMQEGEKYRRQFQSFERQADLLVSEQARLQGEVDEKHRETKRLSVLAKQQLRDNARLDEQLKATDKAREDAMRHLSDMQEAIHDLEAEREAIMDLIESQITEAIDTRSAEVDKLVAVAEGLEQSPISQLSSLAPDSQRVVSPLRSRDRLLDLPPRSYRPATAGSGMTSNSALTSRTDAISILGLARKGYSGRGMSKEGKRASVDSDQGGRDEVAARIMLIQAKLDLALKAVDARNKSDILAAESEDGEKAQDQDLKFPEGGAGLGLTDNNGAELEVNYVKAHTREISPPIPPRHADRPPPSPSKSSSTARNSSRIPSDSSMKESISSRNSNEGPSGTITPETRSVTPTPLLPQSSISRSNSTSTAQYSLTEKIRPGSRLRIRRQTPSRLSDGASSDTSDISLSSNIQKRLHEKQATSSSSAMSEGEMLITPSTSAFVSAEKGVESDDDGVEELGVGRKVSGGSMEKRVEYMDRRLSNISSNTVTFGPI